MEHGDIIDKLSEYRDKALGAVEREQMSRHLSACADCAAALADWERLTKAFLRCPPAPTPFQTEAFVSRVMSRLPAALEPFAWLTGRWLVPALGLCVMVLALSFRPYAGLEVSDPAAALLSGSDRGATLARSEAPAADLLGLGTEDQ
jgi:anti-sigma factor RsiW